MGKQYYCDYCDRSFKENADARKKHLTSLVHLNNKCDHYNRYKEPEEILKDESAKITCKKFSQTGECPYGNTCRFSHFTPPMMWELKRLVAVKKEAEGSSNLSWPNPSEIAKEFFEDLKDSHEINNVEQPVWSRPAESQNYPNLPPSLWPISAATITHPDCGKWGC